MSTQSFVTKINHLYEAIHGKPITAPVNDDTRLLHESLSKIRNEAKTNVLMSGLLPSIAKVVWQKLKATDSYDTACELAYEAETMVSRMEQNKRKSLKATIAGISAHEEQQDKELKRQQTELAKLKIKIENLTLSPNPSQETSEVDSPSIAVAEVYNRHRSPSGDRKRSLSEGRESRVRFEKPARRHSADRSFSQSRGRDNPFNRSRSPSTTRFDEKATSYPR